jgi:hypothetical protein
MSEYKIRKTIEVCALAALLLIGLCQIGLAAESSMSVSPQTISASSGDTFNIDIVVDPTGSDIYGAQYELHFDKNVLKATSQNMGSFLSHGGTGTIEVINNINNTIGKIEYGETRIGDPETVGGASEGGVLASITFEAIGAGTSDIRLDAVLSDPSAQSINVVVTGGTYSVAGTTGAEQTPVTGETPAHNKQTPEKKGLPGFEVGCSIIGLIGASLFILKRNLNK